MLTPHLVPFPIQPPVRLRISRTELNELAKLSRNISEVQAILAKLRAERDRRRRRLADMFAAGAVIEEEE